MDYNDFSSIAKDCFNGFSQLKVLEMWNNKSFKTIKCEAFKGLINLEALILRNNQIARMSKNALKGLKTLESLAIYENRIDACGFIQRSKEFEIIRLI
jgi:Leucine-rich repeat (LRR) protein